MATQTIVVDDLTAQIAGLLGRRGLPGYSPCECGNSGPLTETATVWFSSELSRPR